MTSVLTLPLNTNHPFNDPVTVAIDEETQNEAYNAVANALASEDAQSNLLRKIDQVAASVNSIRATFRTILASLREVAIVATTRKSEFDALVEEWEGHFRTLDSCILDSRCVAARAYTIAEDFAGELFEFLNDRSEWLDDKRLVLAEHSNCMKLGGTAAKQLNLRFDVLDRDLDGFSIKWRNLCMVIECDNYQAQNDVDEQQRIVDDFKSKLSLAKKKTRLLFMSLCGVGALCAAVTVGVVFCPVTIPSSVTALAVPGAAVGILIMAGLRNACATTSSDTKSLDEQLTAMNIELEGMVLASKNASDTLDAALLKKGLDFAAIRDIGLLSDIWSMVSADISTLEERIDLLQSQTTESLFYKRLNATIPLYRSLARALRKYAHAIPDKLP